MSASNLPLSQEQPGHNPLAELANRVMEPAGVLRKNLKMQVYLGIAVLFILATAISSLRHKPIPKQQAQAVPLVQDSNANIEEMKRSLELEEQQAAAIRVPNPPHGANAGTSAATSGTVMPASDYPCITEKPCQNLPAGTTSYASYRPQPSPQQQGKLQLQQQERELAYKARFASNLAYVQDRSSLGPSSFIANNEPGINAGTALRAPTPPTGFSDPPSAVPVAERAPSQAQDHAAAEVNINSAVGQPYVIYEGTFVETVLMNRLDGDTSGPVKVLVTNSVYSHDHQHVLIPEGTVLLGETRKIGGSGFGQQRRLAVVFHRMLMPDGFSVDLDQFRGLNQVGETGLKDKVNNHYFQIFGASIALGLVSGAAEASNSDGIYTGNGIDTYKYGIASSLSQSSTTILDKFISIPPTITIREGHRVKVYISQDLLLPAYENHRIPDSF
jgi:type IV secretory pathway VirB10-like protein